MFISKRRIDEDLEIARRSFENPMGEDPEESRIDDSQSNFTFSEVLSLISAAFWVILPWVVAFAVLLGIVGWLVMMWMR